jgi:hypothetical protein
MSPETKDDSGGEGQQHFTGLDGESVLHRVVSCKWTVPVPHQNVKGLLVRWMIFYTKKRNSLFVERAGRLIFLKSVEPPLGKFNPEPYVQSWLRSGMRSAEETGCRKCDAPKQVYYDSIWNLLNRTFGEYRLHFIPNTVLLYAMCMTYVFWSLPRAE